MRKTEKRKGKQEKRKKIEESNWLTPANLARSGRMHATPVAKEILNTSITNTILTKRDALKRYVESL